MRSRVAGIAGIAAAALCSWHAPIPTVGATVGPPLIGISVPSKSATVASEQAGKIMTLRCQDGDRVAKEQTLFQLNSRLEELEVERLRPLAESNLIRQRAEVTLRHAEQQERRVRDLRDKDIASDSDLQTQVQEVELARIRLQQADMEQAVAKNQMAQAIERLSQRSVKSPFDGIVTQRWKSEGESVERFVPVLEVMSLDPLWVEFDCPLIDGAHFALGTEVTLHPSVDPKDIRTGKIVFLSVKATASSHTFVVRAAVQNPDFSWKTGLKMMIEKPTVATAEATPRPGK